MGQVYDMKDTWFSSDQHYYHLNVIQYCKRPFSLDEKGVTHMNETLVKNHNEVVKPNDRFISLGDFSLAIRPVELYTPRMNGDKEKVPGNHDWNHPANKKSRGKDEHGQDKLSKWNSHYEKLGWKVLPIQTTLEIPGVATVNMCHLPYMGDTTDDRYQNYRLKDDGRWLFCGHVHEKWRMKGKMINVGVDAWGGYPVNLNTLVQLMLENPDGANLGIIQWK
jgi:calcineurin-like phosphoesterase family protein